MKPTRVQKDTFLHPFCVLSAETSLPSLRVSYAQLCCSSETGVPVSTGGNTRESTAACAACFAGVIACVRADDSPAIDAFGVGTFLGPTELPNLRALLAFAFYQAASLHSDLLRRPAAQQKCSPRNGNLREREFLGNHQEHK